MYKVQLFKSAYFEGAVYNYRLWLIDNPGIKIKSVDVVDGMIMLTYWKG